MKPDILEGTRKQFGYLRLEQPNCFAVKADVYPHHAIRLIDNNLILVSVHSTMPFMAHIIPYHLTADRNHNALGQVARQMISMQSP